MPYPFETTIPAMSSIRMGVADDKMDDRIIDEAPLPEGCWDETRTPPLRGLVWMSKIDPLNGIKVVPELASKDLCLLILTGLEAVTGQGIGEELKIWSRR